MEGRRSRGILRQLARGRLLELGKRVREGDWACSTRRPASIGTGAEMEVQQAPNGWSRRSARTDGGSPGSGLKRRAEARPCRTLNTTPKTMPQDGGGPISAKRKDFLRCQPGCGAESGSQREYGWGRATLANRCHHAGARRWRAGLG